MQTVEFCLPCDNSLESVFSPGFDLNLQWLITIMKEKKEEEEKRRRNNHCSSSKIGYYLQNGSQFTSQWDHFLSSNYCFKTSDLQKAREGGKDSAEK